MKKQLSGKRAILIQIVLTMFMFKDIQIDHNTHRLSALTKQFGQSNVSDQACVKHGNTVTIWLKLRVTSYCFNIHITPLGNVSLELVDHPTVPLVFPYSLICLKVKLLQLTFRQLCKMAVWLFVNWFVNFLRKLFPLVMFYYKWALCRF